MQWFMRLLASPRTALVRLAAMIVLVVVLFVALGHSPYGLSTVIVGIGLTCGLLLMMRVPMRYIVGIVVGEFVILGLVSLITQLAASGVFALLALMAGVFVLVVVMRRARGLVGRGNPAPWSRRNGLGPWWLPRRRRSYP